MEGDIFFYTMGSMAARAAVVMALGYAVYAALRTSPALAGDQSGISRAIQRADRVAEDRC